MKYTFIAYIVGNVANMGKSSYMHGQIWVAIATMLAINNFLTFTFEAGHISMQYSSA